MSVGFKVPVVVAVVLSLVLIKQQLQGFMTVFPMVSIVAAYEARHSLWTICRQIPLLILCMLPMMGTVHIAQAHMPFGLALLVGWVVFLALLLPTMRRYWRRCYGAGAATADLPVSG